MSDSFYYKPLTIHIAVWDTNINDGECVFKADILFFFRKWENNEWRITRKSLDDLPCVDDVTYYLKSCHLSRVKVTEYEFILARAGNFHHLTMK